MQRAFRIVCLLTLAACFTPAAWGKPYEETKKSHGWFSFNRPAEKTSALQMARADKFKADGDLSAASKAYHALVITWPGSAEAPTAQLNYAQLLEKRGKLTEAFDAYEYLMEHYAGYFPYDDVLARQFDIARAILDTRKGKFLMFGGWKAPERAIPLFEKIVENGPRLERAPEAQYLIGKAYELSLQEDLAVGAYLIVQQRYPDSPYAAQAAFGRARCWYKISEDSPNDKASLDQAWTAVTTYLAANADADNADLARAMKDTLYKRRAKMSYEKAVYYDKTARKPKAALSSYQSFVKLFPTSEWTGLAQVRIDALSKSVEAPHEN